MLIEAAGAVLWRRRAGRVEVAVIHRPHRGDWTLPKGKLEAGEDALEAARREVSEETGYHGDTGAELPTVRYEVRRDGRRRPKRVRYWAMEATAGGFHPTGEVDDLRWLPPAEAGALLTYERDRAVLEQFVTQAQGASGGAA